MLNLVGAFYIILGNDYKDNFLKLRNIGDLENNLQSWELLGIIWFVINHNLKVLMYKVSKEITEPRMCFL